MCQVIHTFVTVHLKLFLYNHRIMILQFRDNNIWIINAEHHNFVAHNVLRGIIQKWTKLR